MPRNLFCNRSGDFFRPARAVLSKSSASVSRLLSQTVGLLHYHASAAKRRAEVCTLPLSHSGRDRTSWQPTTIARHSHPSEFLCCHKCLLVTRGGRTLPAAFATFPVVLFQPRGIPSFGVSLTTLLSIAIAVVIRRHPWSACYPCPIQVETEPPDRLPPASGSHRDDLGGACLSPAIAGSRQATFASRLPKSDGPLCLF